MIKNMLVGFVFGVIAVGLGTAGYNLCVDKIKEYQEDKAEEAQAKAADALAYMQKEDAKSLIKYVHNDFDIKECAKEYAFCTSYSEEKKIDNGLKSKYNSYNMMMGKIVACDNGNDFMCTSAVIDIKQYFLLGEGKYSQADEFGYLKYLCDEKNTDTACIFAVDYYRPGNGKIPKIESKKLYLKIMDKLCLNDNSQCYDYAEEYLTGEIVERNIEKAKSLLNICKQKNEYSADKCSSLYDRLNKI